MNAFLLLSTLNLSLAGLVFLLGFVIVRENPRQRLNRVVGLMLFFGGFGAVLAALTYMGAQVGPAAAGTTAVLQSMSYVWEFFFPTLFLFACIFPEDRPFIRKLQERRWGFGLPGLETLVYAPHVVHFALALTLSFWKPEVTLRGGGMVQVLASVLNVFGVIVQLFLLVHRALFSLVNLGFGIATMVLLFDAYRRARVPRLRHQLRAIAIGLSGCLAFYSSATSIPTLFNLRLDGQTQAALTLAALTLGPGSIAYAVVRHKFLDARLLARRGILYTLASAALVGLWLALVDRLRGALGGIAGFDPRVLETVFLILALALFQPAIGRLEEWLDRMLMRDPNDYRNVLRALGHDLQTTIDLDLLLGRTIRTLAAALLPRGAWIVALTGDGCVARSGAGGDLSPEFLQRLRVLLPRVSPEVSSARLGDEVPGLGHEERHELRRGCGASLLVPLRWRGDLVGALLLGPKLVGADYTSEDVNLLTTLAAQVSVSLQNALLLGERVALARVEEELHLARRIQRTSLISEFPAIERCEVHAFYIPSKQVGGDFYDVVPVGDGSHLVAIADVSGKGMPAALLSAMLQASLRTQAGSVRSLPDILRNINTLLYRSTETHQFATFFLAHVDGANLELTFSNAGHNWPVLVRRGGEHRYLERGGMLLGMLEQVEFETDRVRLAPGDVVLLYTDGITEARDQSGQEFGEERLVRLAAELPRDLSARAMGERLLAAHREFLAGTEPQDDITLVMLRVLEPEPAGAEAAPAPEAVATR
jgi:serine phosphatase RsbU (regulator of sigma subunit)